MRHRLPDPPFIQLRGFYTFALPVRPKPPESIRGAVRYKMVVQGIKMPARYPSARFQPHPKVTRTKRTSFRVLEFVEARPPRAPQPSPAIHVSLFRCPQSSP